MRVSLRKQRPAGRFGPSRFPKQLALMTVPLIALLIAAPFLFESNPAFAESHKDMASPPGTLEFIGHNLFGDAHGVFHQWSVSEHHMDLEKPKESFAVIQIDLSSLDTGIKRRDDHLRSPDFFETETYPAATARAHTFIRDEANQDAFVFEIDLDLHGVQKTIDGQARLINQEGARITFEGETEIDRLAFSIGPPANRWNPMAPRAEIPIRFRITLGTPSTQATTASASDHSAGSARSATSASGYSPSETVPSNASQYSIH